MMKGFERMVSYGRQDAAAYAAYMIGGSLFHSCRCANACEARRLYLHYAEMKRETQYYMEKSILRGMKVMEPWFKKELGDMMAVARFRRVESTYRVDFLTGGFPSFSILVNEIGEVMVIPFAG